MTFNKLKYLYFFDLILVFQEIWVNNFNTQLTGE